MCRNSAQVANVIAYRSRSAIRDSAGYAQELALVDDPTLPGTETAHHSGPLPAMNAEEKNNTLIIRGTIEQYDVAINLIADGIEKITLTVPVRSRNFR